jgi:tetratricopeptide (TPR) repeat protein
VFTGSLIVMAIGFPVVLFTGYTQYVARKVAQATPTLTPRGTVVRPSASGTLAQLAVKASPHVSWHRAARGGIAALTIFALLVAGYLVLRVLGIGPSGSLLAAGKLNAQDRVLVAAFDAASKDTALGDVVSEAVRTNLSQSRAVNVVSTSTLVGALQRMQRKPTDRLDMALARDLAQREGIKAVVGGTITPVGGSYIITARLVSAASGDELAVYRETAKDAEDIIPTVDRLTRQLRGRIGESLKSVKDAPALSQVTTSSLDALRAFAAGLRANDVQGDYTGAIPLFEEAIRRDSGFAAAYVQLAYSMGNAGIRTPRRDSLLAKAYQLRDRLPEAERYNIEGAYWVRRDRPKAIAAWERAVALDSFNTDALNSLALVYSGTRDYGKAERLYRRAVRVEPENGVILSNLSATLLAAGKVDAADSLLRDMRARKVPYPTTRRDGDVLYARGRWDSLETLARVTARGTNASLAAGATGYLRDLVALRGRFRESDSIARAMIDRGGTSAERSSRFDLAIGQVMTDGWFRGRTQQGIARLDSLARAHPVRDSSEVGVPLEIASIYAILGAPDKARALEREARSIVRDSATRRSTQSRFASVEGDIAMAEGRAADAAAAYHRSEVGGDGLPEGCAFCATAFTGIAYDRANMADSAIANLERYIAVISPGRISLDRWLLAPALKRLGELYEAKGDNARAVSHYSAFVQLWEHADPDMQPKVAEVRARMERLSKTLAR